VQPAPFDISVGRYAPGLTFPPYRHVPGHTPHPRTDPAGHSHGLPEPASEELRQDNWHAHPAYLFGADLFNHAYWWEAHEHWEAAWKSTADEVTRSFLQGLIQLAAALIKWHAGNERGQARLWRRSRARLQSVAEHHPVFLGLEVPALVARSDRFLAAPGAGGLLLQLQPRTGVESAAPDGPAR
jgi:hypothetical protein